MIATKYINENFNENLHYYEDEMIQEVNKYRSEDDFYKLMSYLDSNIELTAKLINVIDKNYLLDKKYVYFKNVLKESKEYNTDVAVALWALSRYKEPALLTIYELLETNTLESRDKMYLALALVELGDNKTAKKYYEEFTVENLKQVGDNLYFETIKVI